MFVKIKDLEVYYEIHGSGFPILMIHGWSPDHRLMTGCMEPLFKSKPDKWQRIYFDLPGMGKTNSSPWVNGSDKMLEFVMAFIDKIIPDQPFIVAGESYGGYLSRGIVCKKRDYLKGLLLICPLAIHETQYEHAPFHQVLEKDDKFLETLPKDSKEKFTLMAVRQTQWAWNRFKAEILPGIEIADYDFLSNYLAQNIPYSFNVDDLIIPFDKPTLMITGRQDSIVGYSDLWTLLENYPRATFAVLDKAGHNAHFEQTNLFNSLVLEWLDRITDEIIQKK